MSSKPLYGKNDATDRRMGSPTHTKPSIMRPERSADMSPGFYTLLKERRAEMLYPEEEESWNTALKDLIFEDGNEELDQFPLSVMDDIARIIPKKKGEGKADMEVPHPKVLLVSNDKFRAAALKFVLMLMGCEVTLEFDFDNAALLAAPEHREHGITTPFDLCLVEKVSKKRRQKKVTNNEGSTSSNNNKVSSSKFGERLLNATSASRQQEEDQTTSLDGTTRTSKESSKGDDSELDSTVASSGPASPKATSVMSHSSAATVAKRITEAQSYSSSTGGGDDSQRVKELQERPDLGIGVTDFAFFVRSSDRKYQAATNFITRNKIIAIVGKENCKSLLNTGGVDLFLRRPLVAHLPTLRKILFPRFMWSRLRCSALHRSPQFPKIVEVLSNDESALTLEDIKKEHAQRGKMGYALKIVQDEDHEAEMNHWKAKIKIVERERDDVRKKLEEVKLDSERELKLKDDAIAEEQKSLEEAKAEAGDVQRQLTMSRANVAQLQEKLDRLEKIEKNNAAKGKDNMGALLAEQNATHRIAHLVEELERERRNSMAVQRSLQRRGTSSGSTTEKSCQAGSGVTLMYNNKVDRGTECIRLTQKQVDDANAKVVSLKTETQTQQKELEEVRAALTLAQSRKRSVFANKPLLQGLGGDDNESSVNSTTNPATPSTPQFGSTLTPGENNAFNPEANAAARRRLSVTGASDSPGVASIPPTALNDLNPLKNEVDRLSAQVSSYQTTVGKMASEISRLKRDVEVGKLATESKEETIKELQQLFNEKSSSDMEKKEGDDDGNKVEEASTELPVHLTAVGRELQSTKDQLKTWRRKNKMLKVLLALGGDRYNTLSSSFKDEVAQRKKKEKEERVTTIPPPSSTAKKFTTSSTNTDPSIGGVPFDLSSPPRNLITIIDPDNKEQPTPPAERSPRSSSMQQSLNAAGGSSTSGINSAGVNRRLSEQQAYYEAALNELRKENADLKTLIQKSGNVIVGEGGLVDGIRGSFAAPFMHNSLNALSSDSVNQIGTSSSGGASDRQKSTFNFSNSANTHGMKDSSLSGDGQNTRTPGSLGLPPPAFSSQCRSPSYASDLGGSGNENDPPLSFIMSSTSTTQFPQFDGRSTMNSARASLVISPGQGGHNLPAEVAYVVQGANKLQERVQFLCKGLVHFLENMAVDDPRHMTWNANSAQNTAAAMHELGLIRSPVSATIPFAGSSTHSTDSTGAGGGALLSSGSNAPKFMGAPAGASTSSGGAASRTGDHSSGAASSATPSGTASPLPAATSPSHSHQLPAALTEQHLLERMDRCVTDVDMLLTRLFNESMNRHHSENSVAHPEDDEDCVNTDSDVVGGGASAVKVGA